MNRSALIREALRARLKNLEILEQELRDRKGYGACAEDEADLSGWEAEAALPEK